MSSIKEIRRVTTYTYIQENKVDSKWLDTFTSIGDELGHFYTVKYASGDFHIFGEFKDLPKRARRIIKNSYNYNTEYYSNSEIKIWEC